MTPSSSGNSSRLKGYVPFLVAALMLAYVIALAIVIKTDVERTTALLRRM